MAILDRDGNKLTPTEAAKYMVGCTAGNALEDWTPYLQCNKLTRKETQKVGEALDKQYHRVMKLLGRY